MAKRSTSRASQPEPHEGYIAVGFVRGPHGLDGEVKVESLSDNPDRFAVGAVFRAGERELKVRTLRVHRGVLLIGFAGVKRREHADALRGRLLEVPETELAPLDAGEYYRFQLIGLDVRDIAGEPLGRLDSVLDTGANDVYVVSDGESELLVPAIDGVVKSVDLQAGTLVVDPPPGLERRPLKAGQSRGSAGAS